MKGAHDHTFIGAGFAVLLVMQVEDLPVPISMSWRTGYGETPRMWVQVREKHFRAWLDQLHDPELSTDPGEDHDTHLHAEGALADAPNTTVHLITVTSKPLCALEV